MPRKRGTKMLHPLLFCMIAAGLGSAARVAAQYDFGPLSTDEYDAQMLAVQNEERARVKVQPLQWDGALATNARRWADEMARRGVLMHSSGNDQRGMRVGENIWAGTRGAYKPYEMVNAWLDERDIYKPGAFPANSTTGEWHDVGHYTQIIWARTRYVGCAVAQGEEFDFLVCQYREAGNVMGQRPV